MAWLFGSKENGDEIIAAGEAAVAKFEYEKRMMEEEKESMLRRQVEIWSVSSSESSQGLEDEYKRAAGGVAFNVKRIICLEEHVKELRLALFHAKKGEFDRLKKALEVEDPCSAVTPEVAKVEFKGA